MLKIHYNADHGNRYVNQVHMKWGTAKNCFRIWHVSRRVDHEICNDSSHWRRISNSRVQDMAKSPAYFLCHLLKEPTVQLESENTFNWYYSWSYRWRLPIQFSALNQQLRGRDARRQSGKFVYQKKMNSVNHMDQWSIDVQEFGLAMTLKLSINLFSLHGIN